MVSLPVHNRFGIAVFALVLALAGCASTRVTSRQDYMRGRLPRPNRILVYDLAATRDDLPAQSTAPGPYSAPSTPQTAEEIAIGRELGAQVAKELVAAILDMGLPAERAPRGTMPPIGDVLIKGYFASVEEGSAAKRVVLGFGAGAAELQTVVDGYLMTEQGLRKLGSRKVASGGGKTPGVVVPLVVTAATANPVGLIVGGALKVGGEVTGSSKIEGSAKRTARKIADELQAEFERRGWI